MADEGLDYDDLISQNILIRREEKEDKTATVEVLTKQNDDYENLYQKQAEIYHMDVDLHGYIKTNLGEKGFDEPNKSDDSSEYEVAVKPVKRDLSPDYEEADSSSDSDWEASRKPKTPKGAYQCDECDKKCATKHGLMMHKRSHTRQKMKMRKEETPPQSPPESPSPPPDQAQFYVKSKTDKKKEEEEEEDEAEEEEEEEQEQEKQKEEDKVEEQKDNSVCEEDDKAEEEDDAEEDEDEEVESNSPVGNGESPDNNDEDDEEETDLNG